MIVLVFSPCNMQKDVTFGQLFRCDTEADVLQMFSAYAAEESSCLLGQVHPLYKGRQQDSGTIFVEEQSSFCWHKREKPTGHRAQSPLKAASL